MTITAVTTDVETITRSKTPACSFTYYTNSSSTASVYLTSTGTQSQCQGQTCSNFTNCSGNSACYCFTSSRNGTNNGFCGQNDVCSSLTPCASNFDCAGRNSTGESCAIKTCCSAPSIAKPRVCLKGVCGNPAANLKIAAAARRRLGGTAAGLFLYCWGLELYDMACVNFSREIILVVLDRICNLRTNYTSTCEKTFSLTLQFFSLLIYCDRLENLARHRSEVRTLSGARLQKK